MKRKAIICAALLSLTAGSMAHAANQGAYAGIGLGVDKAKIEDAIDRQDSALIRSLNGKVYDHHTSLAGRVFGGYNFNQYVGLEAGYNAFGTSKETVKIPGDANTNIKYKLSSFDVRGKAYLPLMDNSANVYAIAGLAYAKQHVSVNQTESHGSLSDHKNRFRPVFGVGANYDVNKQVTAAVEATRQKGIGNLANSTKSMPNVDTLMFTVAYNFA